ncbi:MAG: hypothetical protein MZW92_15320 [Comamonadaceae bacterium]|nr:hypothetical protein [Comamonadaceae bacterium]
MVEARFRPCAWRTGRWTLAGAAYFGFAILVLVLRYGVLPNIDSYRGDLGAHAHRILSG